MAPGQHSSFCNSASNLTDSRFEPQNYRSRDGYVTARPIGRYGTEYVISSFCFVFLFGAHLHATLLRLLIRQFREFSLLGVNSNKQQIYRTSEEIKCCWGNLENGLIPKRVRFTP